MIFLMASPASSRKGARRFGFEWMVGGQALAGPDISSGGRCKASTGANTTPSCEGELRVVTDVNALRGALRDLRSGVLPAGSVIRVERGVYQLRESGASLDISDRRDTSEQCCRSEGGRKTVAFWQRISRCRRVSARRKSVEPLCFPCPPDIGTPVAYRRL